MTWALYLARLCNDQLLAVVLSVLSALLVGLVWCVDGVISSGLALWRLRREKKQLELRSSGAPVAQHQADPGKTLVVAMRLEHVADRRYQLTLRWHGGDSSLGVGFDAQSPLAAMTEASRFLGVLVLENPPTALPSSTAKRLFSN